LVKMDFLKVLLLVVVCAYQVRGECGEPGYIRCRTNTDRCIPYRYMCDGDNDCGDRSDESDEICEFIRELPREHCDYKQVYCNGYCHGLHEYCECNDIEKDPRVCQMFRDGQIQLFSDIFVQEEFIGNGLERSKKMGEIFTAKIDSSIRDPSNTCPNLFTPMGGQCLSFLYLAKLNWAQSRAFCNAIGGDLLTIHDVSQYENLVHHIKSLDIDDDFWLGGVLENEETGWEWIDGHAFQSGTPFWTLRYETRCNPHLNRTVDHDGGCYFQGPHEPVHGHCLAITHDKYYYFSDEHCMEKKGILCVAPAA